MKQGFYFTLEFKKGLSEIEYDEITDSFIENVVEESDLLFGGGGYLEKYSGFLAAKNESEKIKIDDFLSVLKNWISKNNKVVVGYSLNEQKN